METESGKEVDITEWERRVFMAYMKNIMFDHLVSSGDLRVD